VRPVLFLATLCVASAATNLPPSANRKVDFEKDVQPILAQKCYSCHGDEAQQSGLRLDKRQNALRGGDYGPVINVGNSAESKLIKRLVNGDGGLQMPPTGALADEEIGILRAIGISRGQIMRTFLIQGGLLGLAGSLAGSALSLAALSVWLHYARNADGTPLFALTIGPGLFAMVVTLAVATGLVAAFAPALRAARLDPVAAIRG